MTKNDLTVTKLNRCTSHCFGGFCVGLCFGMHYISSFAIILTKKKELVALLLLSFECLVTVNVLYIALPHGNVGWSAVCDCGVS